MNVEHCFELVATCPADKRPDFYECVVRTRRVIPVEQIIAVAEGFKDRELYQETLTVELSRLLQAEVETTGHHSGIRTTVRAGGIW